MGLAYTKPGVTVSELVSPSYAPLLLDPTSICIVGPAQGYQAASEVVVLKDNAPFKLSKLNVDSSTIVVQDAANLTSAAFMLGSTSDYTIDTSLLGTTGAVSIERSMQTTIANGEIVTVYFENDPSPAQGDGMTDRVTLTGIAASAPADVTADTQTASLVVMSAGVAPSGDYAIDNDGAPGTTITWNGGSTVLGKFQQVWLDYTVEGVVDVKYTDRSIQLNDSTPVTLPDNTSDIVVKTASGVANDAATAVAYIEGTTTDLDYIVVGSGVDLTIQRSAGTTKINPSRVAGDPTNALAIRVTYRATPPDYWLPTRCYSQYDVETKYGPAWDSSGDSSGDILNPISFAASMVFAQGASSVVLQALFTKGSPNTNPAGTLTDWENTLANLYNVEDINVVVPIISAGGLSTTVIDSLNVSILAAVQSFCAYMAQNQNQLVIGFCGEDATDGVLATPSVLQTHAKSLGASTAYAENIVMITPGSFQISNPVTGLPINIGGQYVAAAVAGMLARYPVQTPITRKQVNALIGVNVSRTEAQKDQDAQAGLCVIEARRGKIQVRDGITTSQVSISSRALNVVRGKHYMLENIRQSLEEQVIGQIVLDAQSKFIVQLLITGELELLVSEGAIVSYDSIQVSADPDDPSALQVRFSYLPAYPLNRVGILFSINQATGVTFNQTSVSNVQGI